MPASPGASGWTATPAGLSATRKRGALEQDAERRIGVRRGRAGRLLDVELDRGAGHRGVRGPGPPAPDAHLAEGEGALHRGAPEPEGVGQGAIEAARWR